MKIIKINLWNQGRILREKPQKEFRFLNTFHWIQPMEGGPQIKIKLLISN
jgi:hypothetical protein